MFAVILSFNLLFMAEERATTDFKVLYYYVVVKKTQLSFVGMYFRGVLIFGQSILFF